MRVAKIVPEIRVCLGRTQHADEVAESRRIARRIAALVALAPALDDNDRAAAGSHAQWPKESGT
ncbi:MAG TPA: hypothetical protein PK313_11910 [Myxococcota bacterium]|nr:hypothetical protein [Myxococcota bacterium]